MKNLVFLFVFVALLSGCTFMQKKAEKFIIDSDHAQYEQNKTDLEKAYLNGKINYSEYRSKMDELEQDRLKSEKEREEILFK